MGSAYVAPPQHAIVRVASKSCTSQKPREVTRNANTWDARAGSGHHHCWDAWDAGVIASGPAKTSISAAQTQCSLVVPPAPQCAAGACPDRIRHHRCCPRGGHHNEETARVTFIRQKLPPLVKRCAREYAYQGRKHSTFIRYCVPAARRACQAFARPSIAPSCMSPA